MIARVKAALRAEQALAVALLATMTVLPLLEIAVHALLGRGISGTIAIEQHLTLWVTFAGAALAAKSNRLLALSSGEFLPEGARAAARVLTHGVAAGISVWLMLASLDLARVERETGSEVAWGLPVWIAIAVMPASLGLTAGRLIWRSADEWRGRAVAAVGLAIPVLFTGLPNFRESGIALPCIALLVTTALGMPLFAALGGAGLLLFWRDDVPVAAVPVDTYRLTAHPMLPAVPLFTLGGYLMSEGGAGKRLLRAFSALVGWMPGGLAIVTTLLLAFFTPLTGASGVTILSLGGLLLPMMAGQGYAERHSIGLVTVSGSIGLLLPPSLPVILYAVSTRQAVDELFLAALIPGILLILIVAAWGAFGGRGSKRIPFSAAEAVRAAWAAKWELALPIILLTAYFGGHATLVETAALTVLYALIVECAIHRDLNVHRDLPRIFVEVSTMLGGFLIILGMALGFTNYLVHAEVPMAALEWMKHHVESQVLFLLCLNVFLIVVGALMDIYSAIFVLVPLISTIALSYGVNPVHLGIIFLANMELGYLMPPMGENLFLASYRFNLSLGAVYRSVAPYLVILGITVLLLTYVPALSLALTRK